MKLIHKASILAIFLVFFTMTFVLADDESIRYKKLFDFIEKTQFIDVHSHPSAGHVKYDGRDYYPTLEPIISRPFWPIERERIAIVDSLQVGALKEIYGYKRDDVSEDDIPELERLSLKFWEKGKKESFNRALDICGIEKVFANLATLGKDFEKNRVLWVPFVDSLLYPFDSSEIKSISADLRESVKSYYRRGRELAKRFKIKTEDLDSYLRFIDALLDYYKKNKAVALKVASAYIRTLWFDKVDKDEAAEIFSESRREKISAWEKYKKLQDFIARYIFLKAGELDLPVHFHTGFGYTATLKNFESNPLNLESVFSEMEFKNTRFVMLHAGYPWWDLLKPLLEKRNVYVEFSAVNWMVYEDELSNILYEWLSYHGISGKIMFGTDAGSPVFFWIAAENSRSALYSALSRLIDKKRIDEEKAIIIAKKIMRDNAIGVHNLD